jgi:hypothetical protein
MRTVLDRYAVITPIGSGGMGSLWEGSDQRLDRKVAAGRPCRDLTAGDCQAA